MTRRDAALLRHLTTERIKIALYRGTIRRQFRRARSGWQGDSRIIAPSYRVMEVK